MRSKYMYLSVRTRRQAPIILQEGQNLTDLMKSKQKHRAILSKYKDSS